MNQTMAKRLRKKVYGKRLRKNAPREIKELVRTKYTVIEQGRGKQLICVGARAAFKRLKKEHKAGGKI